jgi:chromosome segregation ATPase
MHELIQRQEEELQDQLSQIDRKIETIRTPKVADHMEHEMSRVVNMLREENERLRDQKSSSADIEKLKNIIKEMSSKLNSKNVDIDRSKRHHEEEIQNVLYVF